MKTKAKCDRCKLDRYKRNIKPNEYSFKVNVVKRRAINKLILSRGKHVAGSVCVVGPQPYNGVEKLINYCKCRLPW